MGDMTPYEYVMFLIGNVAFVRFAWGVLNLKIRITKT